MDPIDFRFKDLDSKYWYYAEYFCLYGDLNMEWNMYIKGVIHCGINLSNGVDQLVWSCNIAARHATTKLAYSLSYQPQWKHKTNGGFI